MTGVSKVWRKIFVGEEVPLNDLSAEDAITLKQMGVYSLKIRVDLPKEETEELPLLANKYNVFKPYSPDLLDKCVIVGTYNSREEQEENHKTPYKVFDLNYRSTTVFL